MLGKVHRLAGRLTQGLSYLEHAAKLTEAVGAAPNDSPLTLDIAEAYLATGRVNDALASAERGLARAREGGERGHEAYAFFILGEVAAHQDRPDVATAQAHYGAAMGVASELGMRPLDAHCHLGLGKLYRRTGGRAEAKEHLSTAATMYREMGMRFWLEQAEGHTASST